MLTHTNKKKIQYFNVYIFVKRVLIKFVFKIRKKCSKIIKFMNF
jgi:hypothetical protein